MLQQKLDNDIADIWATVNDAPPHIARELGRASDVRESFGKTEWALSKTRSTRVKSALKFTDAEENLKVAQRLLGEAAKQMARLHDNSAVAAHLRG